MLRQGANRVKSYGGWCDAGALPGLTAPMDRPTASPPPGSLRRGTLLWLIEWPWRPGVSGPACRRRPPASRRLPMGRFTCRLITGAEAEQPQTVRCVSRAHGCYAFHRGVRPTLRKLSICDVYGSLLPPAWSAWHATRKDAPDVQASWSPIGAFSLQRSHSKGQRASHCEPLVSALCGSRLLVPRRAVVRRTPIPNSPRFRKRITTDMGKV